MPTVPEMLADLAHIYRERNPKYGDNYKFGGRILKGMFPDGIVLKTEEELNRFHLLCLMMGKLSRYARMVRSGGHEDSLNDLAVYAMMTRECDMEQELANVRANQRNAVPGPDKEADRFPGPPRDYSEESIRRRTSELRIDRNTSTSMRDGI